MAEPEVIFENRDFIVINKPAGMLVHPVQHKNYNFPPKADPRLPKSGGQAPPAEKLKTGETLVEWILARYPEVKSVGDDPAMRPGIVHRLDRETSGVMVVARSKDAFHFLKQLFTRHEIKKTYLALVWGRLKDEEGSITTPIGLKAGTTRHTVRGKDLKLVKDARTDYRVTGRFLASGEEATLLTVLPQTGRTHQIRVHLSSIGHPVVGDALYGGKARLAKSRALHAMRHFLHADSIEFTGEEGSRFRFSADLPADLLEVLHSLSPVPEDFHSHN